MSPFKEQIPDILPGAVYIPQQPILIFENHYVFQLFSLKRPLFTLATGALGHSRYMRHSPRMCTAAPLTYTPIPGSCKYIHHSLLGSSSSVSLSWSLANNVSGKLFIEQNQHMYVGYLGCDAEQSLISMTRRGRNNFAGELEIPKLLI